MKTATAEMQAHISQESTTLAMCVKLILTKNQPQIESISNSNPCTIRTIWPHGFESGDTVRIVYCRNLTALNRRDFPIVKVNEFFFQIPEDTTNAGIYIGHGEARKVIAFTEHDKDIVLPV